MNQNTTPWYLSNVAIIIAALFFWPAALVLLYLRMKDQQSLNVTVPTNKTVYLVIGIILVFFGFKTIAISFLFGLFQIVGGAAIALYSNVIARKVSRNKEYLKLILEDGETSIDKIASRLNVKYDVALNELKTLKNLGQLKKSVIDEEKHAILPEVGQEGGTSLVMAVCPGCGAKYEGAKGKKIVCDYCDAEFEL